ncbi:MAG TPA: FHA domain-containing protein [Mycobacteriales bacterium]|nr:FHA domain-containing protein [Mycobacteriales bacterium]
MPAVLFLLRAVVLILMWGLVLAAIVAVRHDFFGVRPKAAAPRPPRPQPSPAEPAAARSPAPSKKQATSLAVTGGPLAGTTLPLRDTPITIGRADSSTLVLADDYVSTNHARLVPRGAEWILEDLGSTNGTFLDRAKVTAPTPVPLGVPIRVGKTVLELRR